MKKQTYILISITSLLFVVFLFRSLFNVLEIDWQYLLQDLEKTQKLVFLALIFSISLTFFFILFWRLIDEVSRKTVQINLKRLLAGKEVASIGAADGSHPESRQSDFSQGRRYYRKGAQANST